jgi:glycosyltransferase involved in cell wall biosynthesis
MKKLKVLSINKYYRLEGGADREMFNIEKVLIENGHKVIPFSTVNKKNNKNDWNEYFIDGLNVEGFEKESIVKKLKKFSRVIYNFQAKRNLLKLLDVVTPDVAHLHNIHYEISPSVVHALKSRNIPIVMHLHDMRLFCPNGVFFTKGKFCQACMYNKFHNALTKKCVQDSYKASFAAMLANYLHYFQRIWKKHIDRYIIPTKILTNMCISYGIPKNKIDTFDYYIDSNKYVTSDNYEPYFVFFGFHGVSKGIMNVLKSLKFLQAEGFTNYKFKIFGNKGPLTNDIIKFIDDNSLSDNIEYLGFVDDEVLFKEISNSLFVIIPSIGSENSNCVIRESNALGKMVLGSKIGGIPEQIVDEETGYLFNTNDINDLSSKIKFLFENPDTAKEWGRKSRLHVEKRSDKQFFYDQLIQTYTKAIENYNN